ncbi:MAG: cytochrome c3 family protein [Bacteroidetes bacterium]|nr:cytochrome c3 family protein [Bacteroidota bacterium]
MNCHKQIKIDSKVLAPIRNGFDTGEPVKWVKVHMLPDFAYFSHAAHLNAGVGCVSCHGRIDQMEIVRQVKMQEYFERVLAETRQKLYVDVRLK